MLRKWTVLSLFTLAAMAAVPAFGQADDAAVMTPGVDPAVSPAVEMIADAPAGPGVPDSVAASADASASAATTGARVGRVLVLPFVTLNVPEKQLWIGRAVQEDIIADFGKNRMLSPVASQAPSQVEDDATAISLAHKANATLVIRGAAQVIDKNLRLTAQLIDSQSGNTVATGTATGPLTDLLKLEDQLAGQLRSHALAAARAPAPQPYANPYAPVPYGPYLDDQTAAGDEVAPYAPTYSPYYTTPYYPASTVYGPAYTPYYTPYLYDNYSYSYPYYGGFFSTPFIAYGWYGGGFGYGNRFCFPRDFRHERFGHHGGWDHHGWNVHGGYHGWGGSTPSYYYGGAPYAGVRTWNGRVTGLSGVRTWNGRPSISTRFAGGFAPTGIRSVGFHSALSPVGNIAPISAGGFAPTSFGGFRSGGGFQPGGFSGGFGHGPAGGFGGHR